MKCLFPSYIFPNHFWQYLSCINHPALTVFCWASHFNNKTQTRPEVWESALCLFKDTELCSQHIKVWGSVGFCECYWTISRARTTGVHNMEKLAHNSGFIQPKCQWTSACWFHKAVEADLSMHKSNVYYQFCIVPLHHTSLPLLLTSSFEP